MGGGVVSSADGGDMNEAAYSRTVELSAFVDGDEVWVIAAWSDVETPTTAKLIYGADVEDISRPGFGHFAFTPEELATPGD